MATWEEFAAAAPDLAAFGVQRLAEKVAYLATIRPDGGPRVHPLVPHLGEGRLFVYMDLTSPKGHDLRRDSRYALHCTVEDRNGGQGEFQIRGRAQVIDAPTTLATLFKAAGVKRANPQAHFVLFELGIEDVFSTTYEGTKPVRKRWGANQV